MKHNPSTPETNSFSFENTNTNNTNNNNSLKNEPITPSLKKSNSFESSSSSNNNNNNNNYNHIVIPQTPDRSNINILTSSNETPLLSPTKHNHLNSLHITPSKRKSTDFYNLLKSPDIIRSNNNDSNNTELKRRSIELNKIIHKSPELNGNFLFHDNLTTSPTRKSASGGASGNNTFRVKKKKNEFEIKEISDNLKTRLNYANLKIQNGWNDTSINELEKKLSTKTEVTNTAIIPQPQQPKSRLKLDDLANLKGSAEPELIKALNVENTLNKLKNNKPKKLIINNSNNDNDNNLEQEAIMSLISLSSPIKYNPNTTTTTTTTTTTNKLQNNESITDDETDLEDDKLIKSRSDINNNTNTGNKVLGLGLNLNINKNQDEDDETASDYSD
ncbi:hypothetical protein CANARDRAFT_23912 [[Candida] arabinofermentans NRRL YB-2248]|uniref:Uncharacterized protein n=1 Tax=[Candida] arabinofermentans NRRL YB-2248 TaxID=983967 RepID=A0A1E4SYE5_9ASCO|nr:hypothetical protein CANARDRAFT_23912 [[Candida] arabinofermentans NRRL YB-2248]